MVTCLGLVHTVDATSLTSGHAWPKCFGKTETNEKK